MQGYSSNNQSSKQNQGDRQNHRQNHRQKKCYCCQQTAPVLYRAQIDETRHWVFICGACYPDVTADNPHYRYGGTWKAHKK